MISRASVSRDECARLDRDDPLRSFKDGFALPPGVIYLDGNSLGARPAAALARAVDVVDQEWGTGLIGSWNSAGWFDLPTRLGDQVAGILGADPGSIVVTDTTSLNLFKAVAAALDIQREDAPGRTVIVSERDNFPTDLYVIEGLIRLLDRGYTMRLVDEDHPLERAIDDDVAVVTLSHVNYRTGALYDMPAVTEKAHTAGALMIWDLCHSAGAVPISLNEAGADMAVGCTYKYLNGGPGSPAFLWVAQAHRGRTTQPVSGWWGHAAPFAMESSYRPADGIRRFLSGTQPITSLALLEVGLEMFGRVDQDELRRKSLALTDLFIDLVETRCAAHDLRLVTPRDHARRGSHVSFAHDQAYPVMSALIERGVIGDYRDPGLMRFGLAPLYVGYTDIYDAVEVLRHVLDSGAWDTPAHRRRSAVT